MTPHNFSDREIRVFHGVLRLAGDGAELAQLKVQDIADAAGMGKGTLYEYFRSKDEIFLGTLYYCIDQELTRLEALLGSCTDFDALVERAMDYMSDLIDTRVSSYQMVAFTLRSSEYIAQCCASLADYRQRLGALLQRTLSLGRLKGLVPSDSDDSYFLYAVTSAFFSYANALMHRKTALCGQLACVPDEARLREYTRRMLHGALNRIPGPNA